MSDRVTRYVQKGSHEAALPLSPEEASASCALLRNPHAIENVPANESELADAEAQARAQERYRNRLLRRSTLVVLFFIGMATWATSAWFVFKYWMH